MASYSGFSHEKWWFSIVMLVYQRLYIYSFFISHGCQDQVKLDLRDKQLLVEQLVPGHKKDCDFLFGEDSDFLGILILFLWDESNFPNFQLPLDWKNENAGILMVQATNTGGNLDYLERTYGEFFSEKRTGWRASYNISSIHLPAEFLVETDTQQVALGFGVVFSGSYIAVSIFLILFYLQCEAPKIAKLGWTNHSNFTMVYGTYNYTQLLGRI